MPAATCPVSARPATPTARIFVRIDSSSAPTSFALHVATSVSIHEMVVLCTKFWAETHPDKLWYFKLSKVVEFSTSSQFSDRLLLFVEDLSHPAVTKIKDHTVLDRISILLDSSEPQPANNPLDLFKCATLNRLVLALTEPNPLIPLTLRTRLVSDLRSEYYVKTLFSTRLIDVLVSTYSLFTNADVLTAKLDERASYVGSDIISQNIVRSLVRTVYARWNLMNPRAGRTMQRVTTTTSGLMYAPSLAWNVIAEQLNVLDVYLTSRLTTHELLVFDSEQLLSDSCVGLRECMLHWKRVQFLFTAYVLFPNYRNCGHGFNDKKEAQVRAKALILVIKSMISCRSYNMALAGFAGLTHPTVVRLLKSAKELDEIEAQLTAFVDESTLAGILGRVHGYIQKSQAYVDEQVNFERLVTVYDMIRPVAIWICQSSLLETSQIDESIYHTLVKCGDLDEQAFVEASYKADGSDDAVAAGSTSPLIQGLYVHTMLQRIKAAQQRSYVMGLAPKQLLAREIKSIIGVDELQGTELFAVDNAKRKDVEVDRNTELKLPKSVLPVHSNPKKATGSVRVRIEIHGHTVKHIDFDLFQPVSLLVSSLGLNDSQVLKIVGVNDYLTDASLRIVDYDSISVLVKKNKPIKLAVQTMGALTSELLDTYAPLYVDSVSLAQSKLVQYQLLHPMDARVLSDDASNPNVLPPNPSLLKALDHARELPLLPCEASMTVSQPAVQSNYLPHTSIGTPLRLRIKEIRMPGINPQLTYTAVFGYFLGDRLLCPLLKSIATVAPGGSSLVFTSDWVSTDSIYGSSSSKGLRSLYCSIGSVPYAKPLCVSNLPPGARLCFTLWSMASSKKSIDRYLDPSTGTYSTSSSSGDDVFVGPSEITIAEEYPLVGGWESRESYVGEFVTDEGSDEKSNATAVAGVTIPLVDTDACLLQGLVERRMWRQVVATPMLGTVQAPPSAEAIVVSLEFDRFGQAVRVDPLVPSSPNSAAKAPYMNANDKAALDRIIGRDSLYVLSNRECQLLYKHRLALLSNPNALPKFIHSVPWHLPQCAADAYHLILNRWTRGSPLNYLEFLDIRVTCPILRGLAVEQLQRLSDRELQSILLQLVQVLKYEGHDCSHLARFLVRRAVASPHVVGHWLFWHLKAEMHVPSIAPRFSALLEEFLRLVGRAHRTEFMKQCTLVRRLAQAAESVKPYPKNDRAGILQAELITICNELGLKAVTSSPVSSSTAVTQPSAVVASTTYLLPLDPRMRVSGLRIEKCKTMDSKKVPLWLVFENADPSGDPIFVIFKSGDDLRQDLLTLQLLKIMENLWTDEGIEPRMNVYGCVATGDMEGMIEIVLNSDTSANITRTIAGGAKGAFRKDTFETWLKRENATAELYSGAVENFSLSCASYCVGTYVLGIGDRHNDNIMVTRSGQLFHIDFGHFLGNIKRKFGVKRERAPFVFTPDFAYVMGGEGAAKYKEFEEQCVREYQVLRRNTGMLITLFVLMLSTGIPELQSKSAIEYLRNALQVDASVAEASKYFKGLIKESLNSKATQWNNYVHIMAH